MADPFNSGPPNLWLFRDDTILVLTAIFQEIKFTDPAKANYHFTSQGFVLRNDGGGGDLEFSRDGVSLDGKIKTSDPFLAIDTYHAKSIWIRKTGGGVALYRFWTW